MASELAKRALEIAITQIGQEEKPRGSNWGHPIQDYLASVGIFFPAAWCAAVVFWCYDHASQQLGCKNPLPKTGGVLAMYNQSSETFHVSVLNLAAGDIGVMDFGGGLGHMFFIEKVEGNKLHTIEGNTNTDGSREGYEMERKLRDKKNPKIKGYLRY